jgi:nucleotide-binding universal stress UspA family protein
MPSPILVGYDPRTADRAPVRFAAVAARFTGAPLIVGSVFADATTVDQMARGQIDEELAADATQALSHVERELRADGVRAECRPFAGHSVPATLHRVAEELGAGLLVVGSTDRSEPRRVMPGSTAERLMHGAPCPIAVVPRSWQSGGELRVLGIAYSDTPEGRAALEEGLALAQRANASARVITAVKPRGSDRGTGGRQGQEARTFDAAGYEIDAVKDQILNKVLRLAPDVQVEPDVGAQDAAEFVIAASYDVDLLICGSRGYGPKRAVLLGGVSRKVATGAHCPVIVLPRGVTAGLRRLLATPAQATA